MIAKIYNLYCEAEDELCDAQEYAKRASGYKGKEIGRMYHEMSEDEYKHANYLIEIAKLMLKDEVKEISDDMKNVVDAMYNRYLDKAAIAKAAIDSYK